MYNSSNNYRKEIINNDVFIRLCHKNDIYEKKGKRFIIDNDNDKEVAVIKVDGKFYCFTNICPHNHQPEIYNAIASNGELSCPVHGWTYNLETGENVNKFQGIRHLKKFEIVEMNNFIYLKNPVFYKPKWKFDNFIDE